MLAVTGPARAALWLVAALMMMLSSVAVLGQSAVATGVASPGVFISSLIPAVLSPGATLTVNVRVRNGEGGSVQLSEGNQPLGPEFPLDADKSAHMSGVSLPAGAHNLRVDYYDDNHIKPQASSATFAVYSAEGVFHLPRGGSLQKRLTIRPPACPVASTDREMLMDGDTLLGAGLAADPIDRLTSSIALAALAPTAGQHDIDLLCRNADLETTAAWTAQAWVTDATIDAGFVESADPHPVTTQVSLSTPVWSATKAPFTVEATLTHSVRGLLQLHDLGLPVGVQTETSNGSSTYRVELPPLDQSVVHGLWASFTPADEVHVAASRSGIVGLAARPSLALPPEGSLAEPLQVDSSAPCPLTTTDIQLVSTGAGIDGEAILGHRPWTPSSGIPGVTITEGLAAAVTRAGGTLSRSRYLLSLECLDAGSRVIREVRRSLWVEGLDPGSLWQSTNPHPMHTQTVMALAPQSPAAMLVFDVGVVPAQAGVLRVLADGQPVASANYGSTGGTRIAIAVRTGTHERIMTYSTQLLPANPDVQSSTSPAMTLDVSALKVPAVMAVPVSTRRVVSEASSPTHPIVAGGTPACADTDCVPAGLLAVSTPFSTTSPLMGRLVLNARGDRLVGTIPMGGISVVDNRARGSSWTVAIGSVALRSVVGARSEAVPESDVSVELEAAGRRPQGARCPDVVTGTGATTTYVCAGSLELAGTITISAPTSLQPGTYSGSLDITVS